MNVIGITGGIGSGKSTVARMLREKGWIVYASDETARSLMDTDTGLQHAIVDLLGTSVRLPSGALDRQAIAAMVFGATPQHKQQREALDRLVHPRVLQHHLDALERHRAEGAPLVAIESALIYEVGLDEAFDYIILVDAPEELRIARAMERSGISRDEVLQRMAAQIPAKDVRGLADVVIDNGGSVDDLQRTVNLAALVIGSMPDAETRVDDDDASDDA
jgi:dephospho-CoA kinase